MGSTYQMRIVVAVAFLAGGALAGTADAGPRRDRQNTIRREATVLSAEGGQLQHEVDTLRADMQKAQEEYSAAKKEMDVIHKEVEAAEKAARDAGRKLAEVVQQIEDAEPNESPLARSKSASAAARAAYDRAVTKAEGSAEFAAALAAAKSADDRSAAIHAARKTWIDDNPAVAEAAAKWRSARSDFEARREVLLRKSDPWQRASKAAADAKRAREDAIHSRKATATAQRESTAKKELARLRSQLDAKAAALARVQAVEKTLPRRPPPPARR